MKYRRLAIEIESPEQFGYDKIKYNLAESSYRDQPPGDLLSSLDDVLMSYGDHLGLPALRSEIAKLYKIEGDEVITTIGAAHALFLVYQTLLEKGDHIIVASPNYSNNLEMPKVMETDMSELTLEFDRKFEFDLDDLKVLAKTNTRLISLTTPHNPSGTCISPYRMDDIINFCEEKGIYLLLDLTYLDLDFGGVYKDYNFLKSGVTIVVSSLSKSSGMPGIRMGWLACKDQILLEEILAAKEQSILTHSVLDEHVALRFMQNHKNRMQAHLQVIKTNLEIVKEWMTMQDIFTWVEPAAGCIGFVRFKNNIKVDIEKFYNVLVNEYACYVGPGHWFDFPDWYFRLGFGYPATTELKAGLSRLIKAAEESM